MTLANKHPTSFSWSGVDVVCFCKTIQYHAQTHDSRSTLFRHKFVASCRACQNSLLTRPFYGRVHFSEFFHSSFLRWFSKCARSVDEIPLLLAGLKCSQISYAKKKYVGQWILQHLLFPGLNLTMGRGVGEGGLQSTGREMGSSKLLPTFVVDLDKGL